MVRKRLQQAGEEARLLGVGSVGIQIDGVCHGQSFRVRFRLLGRRRGRRAVSCSSVAVDFAVGDRRQVTAVEIQVAQGAGERQQGAAGILQALLDRGAVGLATTHDLALTELAKQWGERARNVHFADTWADGQISFDYQLRPGVVSHGNALALMRAVGLEV